MATKKSTTKAKTKNAKAKTAKKTTVKTDVKKQTAAKNSRKTLKKAVKKPAVKKAQKKSVTNPFVALKKVQVFGALFLSVLAGLVLAYGNDVDIALSTSYLTENTLTETGNLLQASRNLFSINLSYVIVGVLAAAVLWRAVLVTRLATTYKQQVDKKFTSINWVELSLFAPWVVVVLSAALGVRDVLTLLLMAGVVSVVGLLGYLTDRYNLIGKSTAQKKIIISKALLLPWAVVAISVWHTYLYGFVTFEAQAYALLGGSFIIYLLTLYVHRQQIAGESKNFVDKEQTLAWLHIVLLALLATVPFM